ncbi:hypothetical protein BGZ88_005536, partial [Linnemannia elongata]
LKLHVLGSTRPSNNKGPCTEISAKAIEIAQTREIFHDEEKPINYEPVDPKPAVPHRNKQQGMKSLDDEEDEELDLNNDEDEEAEESDDIQRLLEENDRALQEALETLHNIRKKRSDILLSRRKK